MSVTEVRPLTDQHKDRSEHGAQDHDDVAGRPAEESARGGDHAAAATPDSDRDAAAAPDGPASGAAGAAAGDAGDEERSAAELQAALDAAERAAEEYLDHLRRERAEFENFRKRSTRERMEALDRGAENLIGNLLGVLDNFGYTLDAARQSPDDQLAKGVEMVHAELVKILTDAGLEEIPGVGQPFDPEVHEALMQVEAAEELGEEVDDPVAVEVLRPGYRFKGRVLRPAAVKVAR
jgi:molecular chaperone GrpE